MRARNNLALTSLAGEDIGTSLSQAGRIGTGRHSYTRLLFLAALLAALRFRDCFSSRGWRESSQESRFRTRRFERGEMRLRMVIGVGFPEETTNVGQTSDGYA